MLLIKLAVSCFLICADGWSNDVIVEAFVVNITGAADPDADGLVHPLLRRYQGDGCGLEVFGIPAMQGVIEFKVIKENIV